MSTPTSAPSTATSSNPSPQPPPYSAATLPADEEWEHIPAPSQLSQDNANLLSQLSVASEAIQAFQTLTDALSAEITEITNSYDTLKSDVSSELASVQNELRVLRAASRHHMSLLSEKSRTIENLSQEMYRKNCDIRSLEAELLRVRGSLAKSERIGGEYKSQYEKAKEDAASSKASYEKEMRILATKVKKYANTHVSYGKANRRLHTEHQQAQQNAKNAMEAFERSEMDVQFYKQRAHELADQNNKLESQQQYTTQEMDRMLEELTRMEARLQAMEDSEGVEPGSESNSVLWSYSEPGTEIGTYSTPVLSNSKSPNWVANPFATPSVRPSTPSDCSSPASSESSFTFSTSSSESLEPSPNVVTYLTGSGTELLPKYA